MQAKRIISVIFKTVAVPVALIALLITVLSYAEISIPLEGVRQQFVKKASEVAGHEVRIDGEVRLAISFYPTLVVDQLHIANEPGWSTEDILSIGEARVQLALLPIISGELEFLEISASTIHVNLEQDSDGAQNWSSFIQTESKDDKKSSTPASKDNTSKEFWIEEFRLSDLEINYLDESLGRGFSSKMDRLVINTHDKSHISASINGISQESPYSFVATADLLRNLASGAPWEMKMQGHVADKPIKLEANLTSLEGALSGDVRLEIKEFKVGKILSWLGIAESLDSASQELKFTARLNGGNLKEILQQSVFKLKLKDGYWNLHHPENNTTRKISYSSATLIADTGNPVQLEFSGHMEDEPIQLELTSNRLSDFFTKLDKLHLDLSSKLSHSTIQLKGDIDLPVSNQTFRADLVIRGKRLDHWNVLLKQNIPPFGPYQLSGNFNMDAKGFHVNNIKTTIGDSDLGGEILISSRGDKTHWDLNLSSQRFQINDFNIEGFSLLPGSTKNQTLMKKASGKKGVTDSTQQRMNKGFEAYPNIDVALQLEARQVLSGKDKLGSGKLQLHSRENFLSVENFELNIPGGFINGSLELQRVKKSLKGQIKLDMKKFDYGILYRHYRPDSPADGLISTSVDLELAGPDLKHLLNAANGQFDFAIWPTNIDASAINLWSVNLFLAILPELNKKQSKFNCGTALLDIKNGQLSEQAIFIDTSKIWMKGNLNVDFPKQNVSLVLFPSAKKAKLFGLQAPMRIKGTFSDIGVSIKPLDIVGAYLKFITSPLSAPLKRAFDKHTEEDLSEFCGEILDREYLRVLLEEIEKKTPTLDEMYDYE